MPETAESYLTGQWVNNLKSTVVLEAKGGVISGKYTTIVSGKGDGALPAHDVTGTYRQTKDGTLITLVVQWTHGGVSISVTSWTGKAYFTDGPKSFKLLWHLTRDVPIEKHWEATLCGEDTFVKQ